MNGKQWKGEETVAVLSLHESVENEEEGILDEEGDHVAFLAALPARITR